MTTRVWRLAKAIRLCVHQGCKVITISMGGLPARALRRAVEFAEEQGVIVCSAAGNYVGFTVWPANYPTVVNVAACDSNGRAWKHSSWGRRVTLTAPGHDIWVAGWRKRTTCRRRSRPCTT